MESQSKITTNCLPRKVEPVGFVEEAQAIASSTLTTATELAKFVAFYVLPATKDYLRQRKTIRKYYAELPTTLRSHLLEKLSGEG